MKVRQEIVFDTKKDFGLAVGELTITTISGKQYSSIVICTCGVESIEKGGNDVKSMDIQR